MQLRIRIPRIRIRIRRLAGKYPSATLALRVGLGVFGACVLLFFGVATFYYYKYQGIVDGVPRVETHLEWQMTPHTDPNWNIKGCYITQITGDPCVYNKHMIFPKPGVDLSNPANFASIGMTVTGMPALAAIAAVVAAPPGLISSADLPLRGFAGRFKL